MIVSWHRRFKFDQIYSTLFILHAPTHFTLSKLDLGDGFIETPALNLCNLKFKCSRLPGSIARRESSGSPSATFKDILSEQRDDKEMTEDKPPRTTSTEDICAKVFL